MTYTVALTWFQVVLRLLRRNLDHLQLPNAAVAKLLWGVQDEVRLQPIFDLCNTQPP